MMAFAALFAAAIPAEGPASIALRTDGPSVSPFEARQLTPQALGDALFAPGHPVLTHVRFGRGMLPPPPPGSPPSEYLQLMFAAKPAAAAAGFCERAVGTMELTRVVAAEGATKERWAGSRLTIDTAFQWVGLNHTRERCSQAGTQVFTPKPQEADLVFTALGQLVLAQRQAKDERTLPFPVSIDDRVGPGMVEFEKTHPDLKGPSWLPRPPPFKILVDPREALAEFPIEQVTYAGAASNAFPDLLSAADVAQAESASAVTLFAGSQWVVGMLVDRGRIRLMRIRREFPPPF